MFVSSPEAKAKLGPALDEGNYKKTMAAPCTAIVAYDMAFFEKVAGAVPAHRCAVGWFDTKPEADLRTIALRNGSLQGAYLLLAARAIGLDCGPMSGFDNDKVDAAFFAGTTCARISSSTSARAIAAVDLPALAATDRSTKPAASTDDTSPSAPVIPSDPAKESH